MNVHSAPWEPPHTKDQSSLHKSAPFLSASARGFAELDDARDGAAWRGDHQDPFSHAPLEDWTETPESAHHNHVGGLASPTTLDAHDLGDSDNEVTEDTPVYYPPYRSDPTAYTAAASEYHGPYRSPALRESHTQDVYGAAGGYGYAAYVASTAQHTTRNAPSSTKRRSTAAAAKSPSVSTKATARGAAATAATRAKPRTGTACPSATRTSTATSPSGTNGATETVVFTVPKPKSAQARTGSEPSAEPSTTTGSPSGAAPRCYRAAVLKDLAPAKSPVPPPVDVTGPASAAVTTARATTPDAEKPSLAVPLPRSLRAAPAASTTANSVDEPRESTTPPASGSHLHQLYARLQGRADAAQASAATSGSSSSASQEVAVDDRAAEGAVAAVQASPATDCCPSTTTRARSSLAQGTPLSAHQLTSSVSEASSSGGSTVQLDTTTRKPRRGSTTTPRHAFTEPDTGGTEGTRTQPEATTASASTRSTAATSQKTKTKKPRSVAKNGGWVEVKGSGTQSQSGAGGRVRRPGAVSSLSSMTVPSTTGNATSSESKHLFTTSMFTVLTGTSSRKTTATAATKASSATPAVTASPASWEQPAKRASNLDATQSQRTKKLRKPQPRLSASPRPRPDNNDDASNDSLLLMPETSAPASGQTGDMETVKADRIVILGIPIRCGATEQDWTAPLSSPSPASSAEGLVPRSVQLVWSLLRRSLGVREENASAKLLLLERALDHVFANSVWSHYTSPSSSEAPPTGVNTVQVSAHGAAHDAPSRAGASAAPSSSAPSVLMLAHHILQRGYPLQLVCAVLLEASDCCAELEQSLKYAQDARDLAVFAQTHLCEDKEAAAPSTTALVRFRVLEALGRLAITRALVRVIDITGAKEQLLCAAEAALLATETPLLGWIALQLGITLELCGFFAQALRVYTTAQALATLTKQPRLLCDVLCCQSIARSAVGDDILARALHEQSVDILEHRLPRWSHLRPLQNMVQLKLQMGDMHGALAIHQTELALAREQHDLAAVVRCYGSIALAERYLQHFEAAAKAHVEELAVQRSGDPRQLVECWTGAASCLLLAGQTARALAYSNKAARYLPSHSTTAAAASRPTSSSATTPAETSGGERGGAAVVRDYCSVAKAWVERADVFLQLGELDVAESLVLGALEAMEGVTASERGQYLLTATMCELDWRCCCVLQRICLTRHERDAPSGGSTRHLWHALQLSEACNTPNTTHARDLLARRARQYELPVPVFHSGVPPASAWPLSVEAETSTAPWLSSRYLAPSLVTAEAVLALLSRPDFASRKIVLYSLPWTENSLAMAYVLSLRADDGSDTTTTTAASRLHVEAVKLTVGEEMTTLLVSASSALSRVFDSPMHTWDATTAAVVTNTTTGSMERSSRDVVYGDTPLWPQHYSSTAFRFSQCPSSESEAPCARLMSDPMYCLQRLYDCLVRPLERFLFPQAAGVDGSTATGLTVIGDGIFTRIPFHALHDGNSFLTERVDVTTCASLALLCVLHAADVCGQGQRNDEATTQPTAESGGISPTPVRARVLNVVGSTDVARTRSISQVLAAKAPHMAVTVTTVDESPAGVSANTSASGAESAATPSRPCADAARLAPFYTMQSALDSDHMPPGLEEQTIVAAMAALVADQRAFGKDTPASNRLYMAVHDLDGGVVVDSTAGHGKSLLELHLPVLPEVREDFCGAFVATDSHKRLAHAFDVSHLWNLRAYDAVLCEGCGTYGGFSIHESGVPVYRALQYAGATRLLLPTGSRTVLYTPQDDGSADETSLAARHVLQTAMEAAVVRGERLSTALQRARCDAIHAGLPLGAWATYTQCGLP